ncbi:MAG TPA: C45 family peptidase [Bryobacteraceae bacterium]
MSRTFVFSAVLMLGLAFTLISREPAANPRLRKATRLSEHSGWIQVHLEGSPADIGFQHGYLLASEIKDNFKVISNELAHDEKKDWDFYRKAAREVFWPHIEQEYRDELQGIVDGLAARGQSRLDVWDIVAMNAWLELPYYDKFLTTGAPTPTGAAGPGDHCSAFVATGSYTRDGRFVIGHNNWTSYSSGERWNIMFDIAPANGSRILMDGSAGLIHSADDFGVNAAGLVITETTISGFSGFDPNAVPEFVRARKAMQYAATIDDFARIMKDGNNGGYANTWLVADRKTNEVASLELGLKNVTLLRTRDGYYVGSNFPATY